MKKTLTPSVKEPSDRQVGKLHDRILSATRKSGIDSDQFQIALVYPGTELEDGMVALLVRFAKKASGIITPVCAQDTGLITDSWTVKSDNLEGDINLANLDYSSGPVREGESDVNGDTMLERAGNAYGSLGFAAVLLKAQDEGKEIFPVESRGKHSFIMPRTVLLGVDRLHLRAAVFFWHGGRWELAFFYLLDGRVFDSSFRFVRPRE